MKKLMLGFAMAAAMIACADVESSNIVGYNNKDACANYSLTVPMFRGISATAYGIQDLIPSGENVSGDGNVNMQTFTDSAETSETFLWLTEADMGVADGDGWYNDDYTTKATKQFADGEGFMFCAGNGALTLTFSGEVGLGEVTVDCGANYSLLGNFRPVAQDIQSIVPQGENVSGDGNVNMQTFTDGAETSETFLWLTEADMGVSDGDGWYNDDYTTKATKQFAPGEGYMFCAGNGACQLKFAALSL